jgi:peptide/nickel transport system substrate-binding protein
MTRSPEATGIRRRTALGALAAGATALTSGCLRRFRALTGWQSQDQLSLQIKTVPADADPYALPLARQIGKWFREAGIDTTVLPMSHQALLRDVLLTDEFDLFVTRMPIGYHTPDALYPLLHSRFVATRGWGNPFGYTNIEVDKLLKSQRLRSGERRREPVADLQRRVADTQPFTVLGFPDDLRAARTDRFETWQRLDLNSPMGYLSLGRVENESNGDDGSAEFDTLRVVSTDARPTQNLNPLAVEFRTESVLTSLLYDGLGYRGDEGNVHPWLAESWSFSPRENGSSLRLHLRDGLQWHDGEALTAEDVAFTYEFLADTTLDSNEQAESEDDESGPIPAPRFQGRVSLVSEISAIDDRTLDFQFANASQGVASRALTVPILPRHVWRERTDRASVTGVDVWAATEALVVDNIPPTGSGPLAFAGSTPNEEVVFEAFQDHFLTDGDVSELPEAVQGGPAFDRMTVNMVGTESTAVKMVASDNADVTGRSVGADTVPQIARSSALDLIADRSDAFYLLGYNAQTAPLTNFRFRSALAHLVDQRTLASTVFGRYARLGESPLQGTEWVPVDLEWDGNGPNPVHPFLGTAGDLDVERARDLFRDIGYRYENGNLLKE